MSAARPLVISYLRFSRPEQLKGDSVRRQLALGEAWAAERKLKLADVYRDLGVSAFRGKNAAEGALSELLRLVDTGKIPRGSVLLVESLDRLSRQEVLDAFQRFIGIINAGITIVTLADNQTYTRQTLNANFGSLMFSLMIMSRAHEESAMKAQRLAHAWAAKRAKIGSKVLTRQLPAWIKADGDKLVLDTAKAAVVTQMVKLALAGHGLTAITKKLNGEHPGLARAKFFHRSFCTKVLHNRSLIGEFQPHKIKYIDGRKRREPVGEPIPNYFPPVLDQQTFYALQRALASRRGGGGPQSKYVNLFAGLLFDANDGSPLNMQDKGLGRRYVSAAAIFGRKGASPYVGFPVDVFERGTLLQLHDLILPRMSKDGGDDSEMKVAALEAQMAEVDQKIQQTQDAMLTNDSMNTSAVVGLLAKLDHRRKALADQLESLRQDMAARSASDLNAVRDRVAQVAGYYKRGELRLSNDERVELRNAIRQVVERIDVAPERMGRGYAAKVKVHLKDGSKAEFHIFAQGIDRMKRDKLGHPIKSDTSGTPPQFKVALGDPRFIPVTLDDGSVIIPKGKATAARLRLIRAAAQANAVR